jgi:pre-rRNA-processing protein IPI1
MPHSALLVLFTTSAQTHIFPEIRIDAIRMLDILLECIPEAVTAGWSDRNERHGSRVLGGYLGILNAGTRYGDGDGGEFLQVEFLRFCVVNINHSYFDG